MIWSMADCLSSFAKCVILSYPEVILKAINSTIITAPSMIIPKSIAPKLIKLASTLNMCIIPSANNKLKGITDATTNPERIFPNNKTTTKITIKQPKIKFSAMVKVVLFKSSLRSRKGLICTPLGKDFSISATRFFTLSMVALVFASFSIITCPSTFSPSPFPVIAPKRLA